MNHASPATAKHEDICAFRICGTCYGIIELGEQELSPRCTLEDAMRQHFEDEHPRMTVHVPTVWTPGSNR